jgi:bifunctional DNA-binding transcriptional regulator/antitoxin component of YhaV-PrlF toxin-antitoxin module
VPKSKALSKVVRVLPKGQITLPVEFRRHLKLGENALLRLTITAAGLKAVPVREAPRNPGDASTPPSGSPDS